MDWREIAQNIIFIVNILSFIALFLFFLIIIWIFKYTAWLKYYILDDLKDFLRGGYIPLPQRAQRKWKKIKKLLFSKNPGNWKISVMEAGDLLADVLAILGREEKSLREKIENLKDKSYPDYEKLKKAVDVYMNVISDPDFYLSQKEAEETIEEIEKFLKFIGYLD